MENHKRDGVIMGQLMERYYNEKGLDYTDNFDFRDFGKWSEYKHIFDGRTSEQQKSGGGNIRSLREIIDMTQEEADEKWLSEYRRIYLQEREMGKQQFASGETYDELLEAYMKEKGFTDLPEDRQDFVEWVDKRGHEI